MTKKSIIRIFQGEAKPSKNFVGTSNKANETKDKFGKLPIGHTRCCLLNTRWGQLYVPYSWIGKRIKVIVEEL